MLRFLSLVAAEGFEWKTILMVSAASIAVSAYGEKLDAARKAAAMLTRRAEPFCNQPTVHLQLDVH